MTGKEYYSGTNTPHVSILWPSQGTQSLHNHPYKGITYTPCLENALPMCRDVLQIETRVTVKALHAR
jgi:hypothetical protein